MRRNRRRSWEVIEPSVPVFETDARRADGPRRRGESDPESERADKLKRRVRLLLFYVVFAAGVLAALVGEGGYFDLLRLRGDRDDTRAAVDERRRELEALRQTIDRLDHDPMAKERIAREQLGLARPGEIQFLLPRNYGPAPEPDRSSDRRPDEAPRATPDPAEQHDPTP